MSLSHFFLNRRSHRHAATARRALLAACLLLIGTLAWADPVVIDSWEVPWPATRPRDPYVDALGQVWFCGQEGDYLARFDPGTGDFRKYDLTAGTGPHNLVIDSSGTVWFAGNRRGFIGTLDPATGAIRTIAMPDPAATDPHTLTFDGAGDIWFTVQIGNFVGRLTPDTRNVELLRVPTANARPYGIVIDVSNRPWVALFGTNRLAAVDPAIMKVQEVPIPRSGARPRRIAATADGAIWYGDYAQGRLGRFDPENRTFKEWPLPGGDGSRPYAMTTDDHDRIWIVETGLDPNVLVGFDPVSGEFFNSTPIPGGAGTVRNMHFDPGTRQIWFATDTNQLDRVHVP